MSVQQWQTQQINEIWTQMSALAELVDRVVGVLDQLVGPRSALPAGGETSPYWSVTPRRARPHD